MNKPFRSISSVHFVELKSQGFKFPGRNNSCRRGGISMRSDLVFEAVLYLPNRYQLCQMAIQATRKMHKPNTRVPDTTNQVLSSLREFKLGSVDAVKPSTTRVMEKRRAA
jgi:hypothetical protein